jgi:hypothetical protein
MWIDHPGKVLFLFLSTAQLRAALLMPQLLGYQQCLSVVLPRWI